MPFRYTKCILYNVQLKVKDETLPAIDLATVNAISKILAASQEFMRKQMVNIWRNLKIDILLM